MVVMLRLVLAAVGMVIVWLGLNVSLGGIITLGWQGAVDFISVTDENVFAVQDSHVRFIAGVWTGVGVFMLAGAAFPRRLAPVLKAMTVLVFLGGLARMATGDVSVLTNAGIAPSLLAELIIFPLIGWWIHQTQREIERD